MYGSRETEEDCAPDFRFACDRENPNYAHHYEKYLADEAKEKASSPCYDDSYGSYSSCSKNVSFPQEITYNHIICHTDKAICIDVDSTYKMWIPKSQIRAISDSIIYVTDFFYENKKLIAKA